MRPFAIGRAIDRNDSSASSRSSSSTKALHFSICSKIVFALVLFLKTRSTPAARTASPATLSIWSAVARLGTPNLLDDRGTNWFEGHVVPRPAGRVGEVVRIRSEPEEVYGMGAARRAQLPRIGAMTGV